MRIGSRSDRPAIFDASTNEVVWEGNPLRRGKAYTIWLNEAFGELDTVEASVQTRRYTEAPPIPLEVLHFGSTPWPGVCQLNVAVSPDTHIPEDAVDVTIELQKRVPGYEGYGGYESVFYLPWAP